MKYKSINLIYFEDINGDEAVEFDTIVVKTISDLIEKAKASLIRRKKIKENDAIKFYSPQIQIFVNADNFISWLEELLYVIRVVIYCYRPGKEPNWTKNKQKLDTQYKLNDFLKNPNKKPKTDLLHLFGLLSTVPPLILPPKTASDPLLITPSGKISSESTKVSMATELKEWPNFFEDFTKFKNKIEAISDLENKRIYFPIRFPLNEVYADSEDQTEYHHISWLNSAFWNQIYKDHWFTPAPNLSEKLRSDIYLTNKENTINDFFTQVKSVDSLTLPENASELIRSYKENRTPNDVRIHDAIKQVVSFTLSLIKRHQNERCSYSILTNHNVMYCFKLIVKEDKRKAYLYVSDPIERNNQYLAVFFILLLRYPNLTPRGFGIVKILLDKIDKNLNIDYEYDPNRSGQSSCLTLEQDIYYHYMFDSVVFAYNENYVFAKYVGSNHEEIVVKCCELDVTKSSYQALDEISNEIHVLREIKNKIASNPCLQRFFPETIYLGTISMWKMVVSKYINGECYDYFDEMPEKVKTACVESIRELHKLRILHGDIRAPNFIIENPDSEDPVAVVIDFGRSLLDASDADLKEEFDLFQLDLYPANNCDSSKST